MCLNGALTSISVCFGSVSILESVSPGSVILGRRRKRLTDAVAALEALRPLAAVDPAAAALHAQSVPFAVLPMAFVRAASIQTAVQKSFRAY